MNTKLKIAIGTDAFPPTTDGISCVAANYASILNAHHCKAVVVTPKNPNQQDLKYPYEIFRYKSWWVPSKEGYSVGWPFKESLSYEIIDKGFDLLHSHAPPCHQLLFQAREQDKADAHRSDLPHEIRIRYQKACSHRARKALCPKIFAE